MPHIETIDGMTMVVCDILHARHSLRTCAARYRAYQKAKSSEEKDMYETCGRCEMGQKAALGQVQTTPEPSQEQERESNNHAVCQRCGEVFTPYRHGGAKVYRICQKCMREKMYNSRHKNDDERLVVSFSEHKKLYEALLNEAKEQLRTPEKQLLWILKERYSK